MTDLTVLAVRYSTDVPTLASFYEAIGLTRRLSTPDDGFVEFVAGSGVLMLHTAASVHSGGRAGTAELALETADLDVARKQLIEDGFDPIEWDESYGRHLAVRDPRGDGIWINEPMRDLYGYCRHAATPNDLTVIAVRYSASFPAEIDFYCRLGFSERSGATDDWAALTGGRGVVGLHAPDGGELRPGFISSDNPTAPAPEVTIALETSEPQERLLPRLVAAGLDAQAVDNAAPHVTVTDPDGVHVEIHPAP